MMALDQRTRRAAFDKVWITVRDTHWDPTLGGVNWLAVRKKYLPRALAARTDGDFWIVLQQMVEELKQSHFAIIPPGAYTGSEVGGREHRGSGGYCGASLTLADGKVLIDSVRNDSSAAEAKLTPGMIVLAIGRTTLMRVLEPLLMRKARPVDLALALRALAGGGVGETVPWRVVDGSGAERVITVRYASPPGKVVQQLGLPPVAVESESKRLEGTGVWYFRFNIFLLPNMEAFTAALAENRDAPALILDLRGNPGGLLPITSGIASRLALWPGILGKQKQRGNTLVFPASPLEEEPSFKGPVAILTDELSLSCSEVLAGGLQEMRRARVVGRRTGGMVLPALITALPGGARLEHAIADFKTPKGVLIEGRGVTPDIPVPLTRNLLLADPDPDVTAALKWIGTKIALAGVQ
jgi:carboxyl-terminal processing protease